MIEQDIQTALTTIQQHEDVRMLYACESGSRAWGFPSQDSDYDVRFLYVHRRDWYLSIDRDHRRDVIERPITSALDVNGWDLRKALQLLRKGNPPLLEWLSSPIVYFAQSDVTARLRALLPRYYSPTSALFHYLHMARGNFRDYLRGEQVWTKKYFYVLRPLLAVQWIEAGKGVVPIAFQTLVDAMVQDAELKQEIAVLLERKQAGEELDAGPRNPVISTFIETELERLEHVKPPAPTSKPDIEELNAFFRSSIAAAWDENT